MRQIVLIPISFHCGGHAKEYYECEYTIQQKEYTIQNEFITHQGSTKYYKQPNSMFTVRGVLLSLIQTTSLVLQKIDKPKYSTYNL